MGCAHAQARLEAFPMTVYVDNARIRYGRMVMCHMMADTGYELLRMAAAIGVDQKYYHRGHYNVCLAKRKLAIANGAQEVSTRDLVRMGIRQYHERKDPNLRRL